MSVFSLPWLLVLTLDPAVTVNPAVMVNGDATCPTAEEVSTQVAQLVPALDPDASQDLARIEEAGDVLRVSLWRADGALVGTRDLARTSSCADMAAAAAVVVAAWESDVHPEFMPTVGEIAQSNQAVAPAAVVSTRSTPAPTPTRMVLEAGAALSGSIAPGAGGAGAAAGGLIVFSAMASRIGPRLMLAGGTRREVPLGTGRVLWRRLVAGLGPELRLAPASTRIAVDLHAELLVATLSARGEGFANNLNDSSVDPGVSAGVRLAFGTHTLTPWLDLSLGGWLRGQQAISMPDQMSVALPRIEGSLALGVSVFTGR
jgi:hypothetical protein